MCVMVCMYVCVYMCDGVRMYVCAHLFESGDQPLPALCAGLQRLLVLHH